MFQRVYTDDRSIDEAMAVENSDLVVVPKGYHPVERAVWLRVLLPQRNGRPKRAWHFHNDPQHSWLLDL